MAEVENGAGWCGFLERVIFAGQPWASLTFSQILRFVRRSPVASRLGCGLPGRKLSRLTPTNVGTLCAFLTGSEKCGFAIWQHGPPVENQNSAADDPNSRNAMDKPSTVS